MVFTKDLLCVFFVDFAAPCRGFAHFSHPLGCDAPSAMVKRWIFYINLHVRVTYAPFNVFRTMSGKFLSTLNFILRIKLVIASRLGILDLNVDSRAAHFDPG